MSKLLPRSWALAAALLGLVSLQAEEAQASTFQVSPIKLTLADASSSGLLTVHNMSTEPLRLEVTAHGWSQKRTGEMVLSATQDVVFFPAMISLQPGEMRNIRIASLAKAGAAEQTYRIFVEELPSPGAKASNKIKVLTRFGIPVFVPASAAPKAAPKVDGLALVGRKLSFALENLGNTHFLTRRVHVRAESGAGGILLDQELPAWYVLAGGARDYAFELPAGACGADRLVVAVDSDASPIETSLPLSASACVE